MAEALRPCSSRSFLLHGGGGLSFGMTFGHTPPHPLATIEKCMCVDLHEKARVTAAPHAYIREVGPSRQKDYHTATLCARLEKCVLLEKLGVFG